MSAREWKPGDMATFAGERVVFNDDGVWQWAETGLALHRQDDANADARPLVVIDPEDRDAARRLLETYGRQFSHWAPELDSNVDRLQAALREFANPTPPKPDEPTGLGAVVEDAEGKRYVRVGPTIGYLHWTAEDPEDKTCRKWQAVPAVRVLSEGVTA